MKQISLVLGVLVFTASQIEAERILVLQPFGSKSHKNVFVPLITELVGRGHEITFVTNFPTSEFIGEPKIREIVIEELTLDASKYGNVFELQAEKSFKWEMTKTIFTFATKVATEIYSHPDVVQLVNQQFDLTIVSSSFSTASYPLVWQLRTPFILVSPNVLFPGTATVLGDTEHTEYVPFMFTSFTDVMSFKERLVNLFLVSLFDYIFNIHPRNTVLETVRNVIPDCPPLEDIEANVSVVLTNTHPAFNYPRVLPPDVVEIGAIHCRPPQPLPRDLENFVSESRAGFIIFAVGSAIPMSDMPRELLNVFLNTFSVLTEKVIWQWKGPKPDDVPSNVLLLDWLPQQDLLGHERCKVFITHGGLMSMQEAVYHGVPVLGLPFGTDQQLNLNRAKSQGYALTLEWKELNEDSLVLSLQTLLKNSSYPDNARRLQTLLRDQMETPLQRAAFWIEHVLRHNGTRHLRLASRDLHLLQRLGVDVIATLLLITLVLTTVFVKCVRCCCCRRTSKASKRQQKKSKHE